MMAGDSATPGRPARKFQPVIARAMPPAGGLLLIGIVVVLLCLTGTYLLVSSQREERMEMGVRNLRRGSTLLADSADARIRLVDQWLQRQAARPDAEADGAAALVRDRLMGAWGVADAAGRTLYGAPLPAPLADGQWPAAADNRAVPSLRAGEASLYLVRPALAGAVAWASMPMAGMARLFDTTDMTAGVFMGLRTADRQDLLHSPASPIPASALFSARPLLEGQLEAFMALDTEAALANWRMRALGLAVLAGCFSVAVVVLMSLAVRQVHRQEALARSLGDATRRLESAQTLAGIGTVTLDVLHDRVVLSDNICAWRGLRAGSVFSPADMFALIHPDDLAGYLARRQAGIASRRPWAAVMRVRHADGHYLREENMALPTFDAEGRLVTVMTLVRDVTAAREAEATLRAAMDKLETVVAAGPGVLWHALMLPDDHVRLLYVSPNVETLTGVSWEETMRESPAQQARERRLLLRRRAALAASATPGLGEMEVEDIHPTRGPIRIRSFTRLLPRADGLEEMVGYAVDVTAQRQAEQALAAAEARLAILLDETPGVLYQDRIAADGSQSGSFVSDNIRRMTGHDKQAFLDVKTWETLCDPATRATLAATLVEARRVGQGTMEYRLRHAEGHWIWVRSTFNMRPDDGGGWLMTGYLLDCTEEHALREALAQVRNELETVTASGPGVLWRSVRWGDTNLGNRYVSPNVQQVMGLSQAAAQAPGAFSARAGQDLAVLRRQVLRVSPTPGQAIIEYRMQHGDGHWMRIREVVRRVVHEDGSEELIGYAVDITAQHEAEAALASAQARLAALVEDAPTVLFQSEILPDMSWRRIYISPNIERLTGYSAAWTMEGHNWGTITDPPMRDAWRDMLAQAVAAGEGSLEYNLRHRDGHWIALRSIIRPGQREGGGWLITGTLIEITRERELARALEQARVELQAMVDAGPGALYRAEVGPDLVWHGIFVASAIERITGYQPGAAEAALWRGEGLEPGDQALLRDAARRVLRRESVSIDLRLARQDGGWVWLRNTVRPDPAAPAAGDVVTVVGYLTDISFEKEQATRLAHAARVATLGELTGGVAHDFNNMLAAIANCHAVVRRRSDDPLVQEAMEIAAAAAERGANLVRQMLAFTRHRDSDAEAVEIAGVLSDLHGLLRHACGEAVELSIDVAPGLWPVAAERGALEMVIVNLATNARDAMPQGGRFSLTLRNRDPAEPLRADLPAGDYVLLAARDTGHGMGPDILARSTERFFTTKPAGQGTGLGLAMAEGFVRHWGGAMTISSAEGAGTEVVLLLPVAVGRVAA